MDFLETTFPDGSFDVVWAVESVCHAPDKRAFLVEARRLLRPGGRLGLTEYLLADRRFSAAEARYVNRWLTGWMMPNLATERAYLDWCSELGLRATVRDITPRVRRSLRRAYRMSMACWPLHYLFYRLGLRSKIQHGHLRASLAQYRALRRGAWHYGLLTATRP
jgi:SAM-dependent methyltransferase